MSDLPSVYTMGPYINVPCWHASLWCWTEFWSCYSSHWFVIWITNWHLFAITVQPYTPRLPQLMVHQHQSHQKIHYFCSTRISSRKAYTNVSPFWSLTVNTLVNALLTTNKYSTNLMRWSHKFCYLLKLSVRKEEDMPFPDFLLQLIR